MFNKLLDIVKNYRNIKCVLQSSSYRLLFNWINARYNKGIRLEIAEFLKNQESGMSLYLSTIIERVELIGKAQTKPLDGVLVKIALEQLRQRFPDKYVGIKNSDEGKFIVINDFHKK